MDTKLSVSLCRRISGIVSLLSVVALLAGCGGGGAADHPPSISNLVYSPASVLQAPNGTVYITGTVDFADAGGDIASLRMVSSAGADVTVPITDAGGVKSGTGMGSLLVSIDVVGSYTFDVWLVDAQGSASNHLSGTFEVRVNDTAQDWSVIPIPALQGRILQGVTFGGQQYVAVGSGESIVTSPDAAVWTVRRSGGTTELRSVAWSGTRFVAVGGDPNGDAVILSSANGADWTAHGWVRASCQGCARRAVLDDVIWNGSQFVTVGQEDIFDVATGTFALILTSPDGVNWTQRAEAALALGHSSAGSWPSMGGVAWSGSTLVAVGFGPTDTPSAWTSTDGVQWTHRPMTTQSRDQALSSVTWGGGRFVAVGMGGPAYSSTDGITWQASSSSLIAMNAVTAGPSRYVAVHPIYREISEDALLWSELPVLSGACGNGVLWDGLRYVAVGSVVCTSP